MENKEGSNHLKYNPCSQVNRGWLCWELKNKAQCHFSDSWIG